MFLLLQRRFALEFVQKHGRRIQSLLLVDARRSKTSLLLLPTKVLTSWKRQNENIERNPSTVLAQLPFVVSFIGKFRGGAN